MGKLVGKRPPGTEPGKQHTSAEQDLADGAEVFLSKDGDVAFRVHVVVPARCAACGTSLRTTSSPSAPTS